MTRVRCPARKELVADPGPECSCPACAARGRSLLTGQSTADLHEVALGAAWIAGACLRALEQVEAGFGGEMLQGFALSLARHGDGRG